MSSGFREMTSEDFETCRNVSVTSAEVSGFVEVKGSTGKDFLFITEVTWSDDKSTIVKRSYRDFLEFRKLLVTYSDKYCPAYLKPVCIPDLEGIKLFKWYDRTLAEQREEELYRFTRDILKENIQIGGLAFFVDFFESRTTDPVAYRSPPDGESPESDIDDPFSEDLFDRSWIKANKMKEENG